MSREKGAKFIFSQPRRGATMGGGEGGQKSKINLFLSKHQQIKGIKGVSEGGKGLQNSFFQDWEGLKIFFKPTLKVIVWCCSPFFIQIQPGG